MAKTDDDLITVAEAAEVLGVTGQMVRYYIKTERLPAQRFGNTLVVRRADLDKIEQKKRGREKGSTPWNKGKVAGSKEGKGKAK